MANVSVVIPTYNFGRFLELAVRSASGQSLPVAEIIIVDDGSTDDTEAIVKGLDERVCYIRQENAGVSAARNRGVAESTGELIAFLDADDTWEPTKIEKQVGKFNGAESVGLVHCAMREFDSESGRTVGERSGGLEGDVAAELLLWEQPAVNVSGSAIMVTRKAFDEAEGFDTRLAVGEDWDLCYRIALRHKVGFVPEPLVNYRLHAGSAHRNIEEMERGMGLFYQKAFDTQDPKILSLKNRSLGNYHRVLAGSYFQDGRYARFAEHAAKSLWHRPSGISYFLAFPTRRSSKIEQ